MAEGNFDEAFQLQRWLASHESTSVHKRAVEVIETLSRIICDTDEQLSSTDTQEIVYSKAFL